MSTEKPVGNREYRRRHLKMYRGATAPRLPSAEWFGRFPVCLTKKAKLKLAAQYRSGNYIGDIVATT